MATCFNAPDQDDSAVFFSSSTSPEGSTTLSASSDRHSPPPSDDHRLQLPTPSHKLSVTNLSYTARPGRSFPNIFHKPKPVEILKSVSFDAKSSELLAIAGPSGTGKSTLLRIIAGRVQDGDFEPGSVSINGHRISNPVKLRKACGFVPQDDVLLPLLTVKETLMFSAKFHLNDLTLEQTENRVDTLLQELGLLHVQDSFVGDEENRGISGGERKRVSIAVDLIHDPSILLLDEPTSGLDSSSALQVVELLASMARAKQRIIIFSIHQPSYRILLYISSFLVLSRGSAVHHGSLDSLEGTIKKLGFQIPLQLNALEFAMEIMPSLESLSSQEIMPSLESLSSQGNLCPKEDELFCCPVWQDDEFNQIHEKKSDSKKRDCLILFLLEIMFLSSRFWKIIYRTKQLFLARTMQALVGGFGLASVYVKIRKDEQGVAERLGLFAFSLSFLLSSTVEALPIYLQERCVLMKEASRGAYRISSYMIANTLVFIPFLFVVAIIFSTPVYWIVGLNPSISAFLYFVFLVWLIVLVASSLVLFLSAVSPDFISGNSLICTVLGAFFLFSGYFIPKDNIPKYWLFMYYVSLYRYPLDSLLTNEYWGQRAECFSWQQSKCLVTGEDVLRSRGLQNDGRWMNAAVMFGFFVFYRLVSWIVLARKASKSTI